VDISPPERKGKMASLSLQNAIEQPASYVSATPGDDAADPERPWYAVFTLSQNERSAARHLEECDIESFVPTYETVRVWKNRQRVKVVQALFPTYLFVRMRSTEQSTVLRTPGVRRIVGNHKGPSPLPSAEIEFLRSQIAGEKVEPYTDLVVGERVRIKCGAMQGLEGVLVRKKNSLRFVLTIELINQHAAVEVAADELEPIDA
jgi:transcription antitermination factor NusG